MSIRKNIYSPRYSAFAAEMAECKRLGLSYIATCPVSNIVMDADDMRREGKIRESQKLENAGRAVALAQAVAIVAVRRSIVISKPKRRKA